MPRPLFLGHEPSQAPVVPELLVAARALAKAGVAGGVVSARYGPRFVVNAAGVPLDMAGAKQFVEVADFDPQRDQLLCIGEHAPAPGAELHALVYRAKAEVGAIVQLDLGEGHAALARLPQAKRGRDPLESAMALLEALRSADAVALAGKSLLVTARSTDAARERALAIAKGA